MLWQFLIQDFLNSANGEILLKEYKYSSDICCPIEQNVFKCFLLTPYDDISHVVIGERPYNLYHDYTHHTLKKTYNVPLADGLAFSVPSYAKDAAPSSHIKVKSFISNYLKKEISHNFSDLAKDGWFFYNLSLSCTKFDPNAHSHLYVDFSSKVLSLLNEHDKKLTFVFFRNVCEQIGDLIDKKHNIVVIE